jgi:hypothetical protein
MLKCFHQLNIQTLIDNAPTEGESPRQFVHAQRSFSLQ